MQKQNINFLEHSKISHLNWFELSALWVWVRVSRTEQVISSYFVVKYGMFSSKVTLENLFLTHIDIEGKCD